MIEIMKPRDSGRRRPITKKGFYMSVSYTLFNLSISLSYEGLIWKTPNKDDALSACERSVEADSPFILSSPPPLHLHFEVYPAELLLLGTEEAMRNKWEKKTVELSLR
ncbi:hypothetical protein K1719_016500 [Acacia pycnantha]|nr:hypothetical protein K1719_016500 [Acacia pycnantha]